MWFKHIVCNESGRSDEEIFDDTGFIIKLKNEEFIHEKFRGKGLAEALRTCFLNEEKDYYKIKEKIKKQILFTDELSFGFLHEMRRFEICSDMEPDKKEEILESARKVYEKFEIKRSKGIYKKDFRNKYRKKFLEKFEGTGHVFENKFIVEDESVNTSQDSEALEYEAAKAEILELKNLLAESKIKYLILEDEKKIEIQTKDAVISDKNKEIEDSKALIEGKDKEIAHKNALIEGKDKEIEDNDKIISKLMQLLDKNKIMIDL